jgi:hypothetical protein
VGGCAERPEAHFAGGIAAEHWPVLNQNYPDSGAGGGDRGTGSGQTAAGHAQVTGESDGFQRSFSGVISNIHFGSIAFRKASPPQQQYSAKEYIAGAEKNERRQLSLLTIYLTILNKYSFTAKGRISPFT